MNETRQSKRALAKLFSALNHAIDNAGEFNLDLQKLTEAKEKIVQAIDSETLQAMVQECLELDDTFIQLANGDWNLVEMLKVWGFVQRPDGRWADPSKENGADQPA